MKRRVVVVEGRLAFRMRRFQAAEADDVGLEILTLPLLASRLAGGFCHLADRETLSIAVAGALRDGGFAQLDGVRNLPGMVRAALQSLDRAWNADLDLDNLSSTSARVSDLAMLEQRVGKVLPQGAMLPRQLRDAALQRVQFAPKLFGSIKLEKLVDVEPLWRPLLTALSAHLEVSWAAGIELDRSWFLGRFSLVEPAAPKVLRRELCADPRAEVVEALRWTRELLSHRGASASDIAITAVATPAWDEHILVLARQAGIPIHFSSALWPATAPVRTCARTRIPEHAFSEADRLPARPAEAGRSDRIKAALTCWRNWDREEATAHDGAVRAGHPAVARAVSRVHSAPSLRLMARDPLAFLWRYALDMQPVALAELPPALDPLAFGELVHELLARTIDLLEPKPGFVRASRDEIELALARAVDHSRPHEYRSR